MRYTGNHLFSNKDNNPQKKKYYHYTVDYILVPTRTNGDA